MSSRLALSLRSLASRPTVSPSQVAFISQRALSTSPILRLATQPTQTGPTVPGYSPPPAAPIVPKAQQTVVDYSKGPSALDKASSLFFFTEILRGECSYLLAELVKPWQGRRADEIRACRLVKQE